MNVLTELPAFSPVEPVVLTDFFTFIKDLLNDEDIDD